MDGSVIYNGKYRFVKDNPGDCGSNRLNEGNSAGSVYFHPPGEFFYEWLISGYFLTMQTLFLTALIWAWALTPETLVFVGRGGGLAGMAMIGSLGTGCVLALLCSSVIHDGRLSGSAGGSDFGVMTRVWGRFASTALVLGGRIPLLLFASTGMLVTAGFAFNEIYLYWFPNFLFASLLLAAVGLVHLFREKYAFFLQAAAAILVIAALLTLVVWGGGGNGLKASATAPAAGQGFHLSLAALGFIPFLGFDFHRGAGRNRVVIFSLVGVFLVLSLWVWLVVGRVAAETLATVDVAYMFAARSVAGELGRYVIGVAVIGGAVCGVNGLFIVVRRCFEDIDRELHGQGKRRLYNVLVVVFVLTVEAMMLGGVAGEEVLGLQIRASIVLWLCYLLFRVLAGAYILRQKGCRKGWLGYGLAPLLVLMVLVLVLPHEDRHYLAVFLSAVATAAALLSLVWLKAAERLKKKQIRI